MPVGAACAGSARRPLPPSIKALAPDCQLGGVGFWTGVPLPRLLASKIKQTFLSTSLASLLAFEQQSARAHFRLQAGSQAKLSQWLHCIRLKSDQTGLAWSGPCLPLQPYSGHVSSCMSNHHDLQLGSHLSFLHLAALKATLSEGASFTILLKMCRLHLFLSITLTSFKDLRQFKIYYGLLS